MGLRGGGKRGSSSGAYKEKDSKKQEMERKFALMQIEEGAKQFIATGVDNYVNTLAAKMKKMTGRTGESIEGRDGEDDSLGFDNVKR